VAHDDLDLAAGKLKIREKVFGVIELRF